MDHKTLAKQWIETLELREINVEAVEKSVTSSLKKHPLFYKPFFEPKPTRERSKLSYPKEGISFYPLDEGIKRFAPILTQYDNERLFDYVGSAASQGVVVYLPEKTKLQQPLKLASNAYSVKNSRIIVIADQCSALDLHLDIALQSDHLVVDLYLSADANVQVHLAGKSDFAQTVGFRVHAAAKAKAQIVTLLRSAKAVHLDFLSFLQENSDVCFRSLNLMEEKGSVLVDSKAHHLEEGATSLQHVDMILFDQAKSLFKGHIEVESKAQQTQGYQKNRNLLFGSDVVAYSYPYLDIKADDVKASHGATFGRIDQEQLLFLKTRGLHTALAQKLLIQSFCQQMLEELSAFNQKQAAMFFEEHL